MTGGAKAFTNAMTEKSVHGRRDLFIKKLHLRETQILRLAASACGKTSGRFFQPENEDNYFIRGSYNISFFIEFDDGQKCLFRIPLRPCLAYCARRKLQSEVATMQYLSQKTSIPVPEVLAYCADAGPDALSTFVIISFIVGRHLRPAALEDLPADQKFNLYTSLADIYVQLRRQEFPSIGRLENKEGEFHVGQKTASLEMNIQQLEWNDAFSFQEGCHDEHGKLQSATSYTNMLLCIGYNAFLKTRNAVDEGMAREVIYNHHQFSKHVKQWIDPKLDSGPFVMVHGDMHLSNLLVDDDARVVGVLDWEWSRIVPAQHFSPPLWLTGYGTVQLASHISWTFYLEMGLKKFMAVLKDRELALYGNLQLHDEWAQRTSHAEPLVANALENWTDVDWFVHRYINDRQAVPDETISAFLEEDPLRALLADIKEHDRLKYNREIELLTEAESCEKTEDNESKVRRWFIDGTQISLHHVPSLGCILGWGVAATLAIAAIWRKRVA